MSFHIPDAYTVDDVVYNWKNKGPNSIEVFVTELAQYDLLNITTSKKASTNSKGKVLNVNFHFLNLQPSKSTRRGLNVKKMQVVPVKIV